MAITMTETDETINAAHVLCVLDRTGDTKIIWDSDKDDEVKNARRTFDDLTKNKKYLAYRTDKEGNKAAVTKEFDPTAERMILVPQMQGG